MYIVNIHYPKPIAKELAPRFKQILERFGIVAEIEAIDKSSWKSKGGYIKLKHVRLVSSIMRLNKENLNFCSTEDRLNTIIYMLLKEPYEGSWFFPQIQAKGYVICGHKKHIVYVNNKGNLIIPEHPYDDIETDRALSCLGDAKTPRCIRLLDAWRRGTLNDQDGWVTPLSNPDLKIAYQRAKQKLDFSPPVLTSCDMGNGLESKYAKTALLDMLAKLNIACYSAELTKHAGISSAPKNSAFWVHSHRNNQVIFEPKVATPYLGYSRERYQTIKYKSPLQSHFDTFDGNSNISCSFSSHSSYHLEDRTCKLTLLFKQAVKWYATILKKGIAIVDYNFVTEVLDRISDDEIKVKAIKCTAVTPVDESKFTNQPALLNKRTNGTWKLEWLQE